METERAPVALAAFLARASPAAMPACRSMTPLTRDSKWLHQTGVTRMHPSRCLAVDLGSLHRYLGRPRCRVEESLYASNRVLSCHSTIAQSPGFDAPIFSPAAYIFRSNPAACCPSSVTGTCPSPSAATPGYPFTLPLRRSLLSVSAKPYSALTSLALLMSTAAA